MLYSALQHCCTSANKLVLHAISTEFIRARYIIPSMANFLVSLAAQVNLVNCDASPGYRLVDFTLQLIRPYTSKDENYVRERQVWHVGRFSPSDMSLYVRLESQQGPNGSSSICCRSSRLYDICVSYKLTYFSCLCWKDQIFFGCLLRRIKFIAFFRTYLKKKFITCHCFIDLVFCVMFR